MNIALNTQTDNPSTTSKAISQPRLLLHIEGLSILIAIIALYAHVSGDWVLFIALLFAPDLAMLGYLVDNKVGNIVYNLAHLTTIPAILLGVGLMTDEHTLFAVALIWLAHIWLDRAVGYGFKYATQFKDTHMNRV